MKFPRLAYVLEFNYEKPIIALMKSSSILIIEKNYKKNKIKFIVLIDIYLD
jgi:hypothetical protein